VCFNYSESAEKREIPRRENPEKSFSVVKRIFPFFRPIWRNHASSHFVKMTGKGRGDDIEETTRVSDQGLLGVP
jgi:hypothetical protein